MVEYFVQWDYSGTCDLCTRVICPCVVRNLICAFAIQDFIAMEQQTTSINGLKWTVHGNLYLILNFCLNSQQTIVEVRLKIRASARFETIKNAAYSFVTSFDRLILSSPLEGWEGVPELAASVEQMVICEAACPKPSLTMNEMAIQVHVYQPSKDAFEEYSNTASPRDQDDDTMAATVCELPNRLYEGLWDSLIYAGNIKMKLLDYIYATLLLSDANINCEYFKLGFLESLTKVLQAILSRGTALCYCMVLQGQERLLFVAPLHKSWQSASLTGTSLAAFFPILNSMADIRMLASLK